MGRENHDVYTSAVPNEISHELRNKICSIAVPAAHGSIPIPINTTSEALEDNKTILFTTILNSFITDPNSQKGDS